MLPRKRRGRRACVVACKSKSDNKAAAANGGSSASGPPASTSGTVPRASAPIKIDGEWNDPDTNNNSLQLKFRGLDGDDADRARPYSEARFIHDDANLYVALYASDVNIMSSDAFDLRVGLSRSRSIRLERSHLPRPISKSPWTPMGHWMTRATTTKNGSLRSRSHGRRQTSRREKTVDGRAARCDVMPTEKSGAASGRDSSRSIEPRASRLTAREDRQS